MNYARVNNNVLYAYIFLNNNFIEMLLELFCFHQCSF